MSAASKSKPLSSTNLYILLLLGALLAVGTTVIAGKVLGGMIIRDSKVAAAKAEASKNLDTDIKSANTLVANYQALQNSQTLIADSLPTSSDFPGLIATMEAVASSSGTNLKSVTPAASSASDVASAVPVTSNSSTTSSGDTGMTSAKAAAAPDVQTLDFSMEIDCTYDSLRAFLQGLERSSRPIHVSAVEVAGKGSALSVNITASTAYQPKAELPFKTKVIK